MKDSSKQITESQELGILSIFQDSFRQGSDQLNFRVVHGYTKRQFEQLVSKHLEEGWSPSGSVNLTLFPVGSKAKGAFMIAMVRERIVQ